METVFGVPDRTLSKKKNPKNQRSKNPKIRKFVFHSSPVHSAGLSRLWRQYLGCPMGHCPKKKDPNNQRSKNPKIQKYENLCSIVVQSTDPSLCWVYSNLCYFVFIYFILSGVEVQPFVGGDPFCVVLFSLVLICPIPRSNFVFGLPYSVLVFLRLAFVSRVVILGGVVYQKGCSPCFLFDGEWVAVLVDESLCPFH